MSFPELTVVFVIGLLVLGPERLPPVARQVGRWVGHARRAANQLRYQLEREIALWDRSTTTGSGWKAETSKTSGKSLPKAR